MAVRLAEAGFGVVCLEQGEWLDRADYPGNQLDWELKARKDWATSPNLRGLAADYPIVEDDTPSLPADVQRASAARRSSSPAPGRGCSRPTSAFARSTASPTTGRIDYFELLPYFERTDRHFGVSGLPGDPAYPPDGEDRADAAAADRRRPG